MEAKLQAGVPTVQHHDPLPGDLCGRCASGESPVVARCVYPTHWIINVCGACLTMAEIDNWLKREHGN